jgi:hypothetical protein
VPRTPAPTTRRCACVATATALRMRNTMSTKGREQVLKRMTSRASHQIPIGETVAVLGMRASGAPFIEGRAVVKEIARGPHRYLVQFADDPVPRQRVVHPEYQRDPERMVEIMLDLWGASTTPAVPDFFPEENT